MLCVFYIATSYTVFTSRVMRFAAYPSLTKPETFFCAELWMRSSRPCYSDSGLISAMWSLLILNIISSLRRYSNFPAYYAGKLCHCINQSYVNIPPSPQINHGMNQKSHGDEDMHQAILPRDRQLELVRVE